MRGIQTNPESGFPADLLLDVATRSGPLRERVEHAIRAAIQAGGLHPGTTLPPSRTLAADLRVARSVVVEAYSNLSADGYLEARAGSGTRVRNVSANAPVTPRGAPAAASAAVFAARRRRAAARPGAARVRLAGGLPDPALFPRTQWVRHYRAALSALPDAALGYPSATGAEPLREALARYLGRVRGVATDPDRLVICAGVTQGLSLIGRALVRSGATRIAIEDPCFGLHRETLAMTGLEPVPIPVDEHGLDPTQLPTERVDAVLVAPAHSYPSGGTLTASRRHALAAWARDQHALIIEDDYDAELRYDRSPIGALQGLAPDHVAYIGSASKTLSPALRLGWIATPAHLHDALEREKNFDDMGQSLLEQLAFARLLDSGDLSRHLRRVRPVYRNRRDATLTAVAKHLPEARPQGAAAGLHLHLLLPPGTDEAELAFNAYKQGLIIEDAAWHWARPELAAPAIVLGYGTLAEPAINQAIAKLATIVRESQGAGQ